MNGRENHEAINNMREVIGEWQAAFINKPYENQAKFRIGDTTVYAITTFAEITFVYDDVLITCTEASLNSVLNMIERALNNVGKY